METMGGRLKRTRERANKTQGEVCKTLGISIGTLSGYERDYRNPDPPTIAKLASLYDVSTDYLITGEEKSVDAPPEKIRFLEKVEDNLGDLFFYDFDKSPEEMQEEALETMRMVMEIKKKHEEKRNKSKPKE